MKSNGVMGASGNAMALVKGMEAPGNVSPVQEFGNFLNQKASQGMADISSQFLPSSADAPQQLQQSYEKSVGDAGYRKISKAEGPNDLQKARELEESYEEFKDEVSKVVAKELGITEEELQKAMETLGITFESLLNGQGLKDLVMEFDGSMDTAELLFSDVFQKLSQELGQMVEDFTTQAELTPQEWELVLARLEEMDSALKEPLQDADQEVSNAGAEGMEEISSQVEIVDNRQQPETVGRQADGQETDKKADASSEENSGILQAAEETGETAEETSAKSGQEFGQEKQQGTADKKTPLSQETSQTQQVTYQQTQTTVNAAGETVVQTVERTFVDVQDIMNQITQFTRVTVEQAQSSIEMQLNPAHLGKIYLQVVSREGMITAQLAAQNEAVKQVLENQAAALKENMNQQGLKVEAVEVTIASHEFEQSLEGQRQQDGEGNGGQDGRSRRRFLTADQLDDMTVSLSEEDSLAAKIMLENGNSMDMTA